MKMHPLDNIIWKALTTRQAEFAESFDQARRFVPEVSPLAAFREPTRRVRIARGIGEPRARRSDCSWKPLTSRRPAGVLLPALRCRKWFTREPAFPPDSPLLMPEIIELGDADSPDMMELTALTKPGPFGKRTHELGTYLGIRRDGKLVAMTGERLKIPGYTEVSAVCTHPEHTGHGYARILMAEVMRRICSRGETPLLHVRGDNVRAIELYERLGFSQRVLLHFAVLRKE